jgi:hypothetical protein
MKTSDQFTTTLSTVLLSMQNNTKPKKVAAHLVDTYVEQGLYSIDLGVDLAETFKQCILGINQETANYCAKIMTKAFE